MVSGQEKTPPLLALFLGEFGRGHLQHRLIGVEGIPHRAVTCAVQALHSRGPLNVLRGIGVVIKYRRPVTCRCCQSVVIDGGR